MPIHAVNQVDFEMETPEIDCKAQKTKGLGPKVRSFKIIDHKIDED